jgi:plastocyanin domain-containing protein
MRYSKYALFSVMILLLCVAYSGGAERKVFTASIDKTGVQRVEILGGSYFFDPNYIIVKVNVPVELKIRKESGITPHSFVLQAPEAGMNINVDLGTDAALVAFTPTKIGTYPFYCDKKLPFMASHKERGMEGVLEVRE